MNRPEIKRPKGTDYSVPDRKEFRCIYCNREGMNRTGLKPIAYIGASTTSMWAKECPYCINGIFNPTLKEPQP